MEDIGSHDPKQFFEGCTVKAEKSILRTLGDLHAKYWGGRNLKGHDWVPRLAQAVPALKAMVAQGIPHFTAKFGHHLPNELRDGLDYAAGKYGLLLEAELHLRDQTLCHIDPHLGNIAFRNGQARFFDWQAFMISSGSYDVALSINANLLSDDRRTALPELLNTYHEALIEGGVTNFSRQDVEDHYHRQAALLWVTIPLLASAFIDEDERGKTMAATWLPRIFSALVDSDAPTQFDIWLNEISV